MKQSITTQPAMTLLIMAFLAVADVAAEAPARKGTNAGAIVYEHREQGKLDLYYQRLDNGQIIQLTDFSEHEQHPALSPNGREVVFESDHEGQRDLYVIGLDGAGLRRLTDTRDVEEWPEWSPDGSMIAYTAGWNDENDLFVMPSGGGQAVRYTDFPGREGHVSWSPDGQRIAFHSERTGQFDIYIIDLATGAVERITTHGADDIRPAWSPDGRTLLFQSARGIFDWRIFSYDMNSRTVRALGPTFGSTGMADWSPDGSRIVFHWDQPFLDGELYTMDARGGQLLPLGVQLGATEPSWNCLECAPKGIRFASRQDGVYVADGLANEGFTIFEVELDGIREYIITFYTYRDNGQSQWLIGMGPVEEVVGDDGAALEIVEGAFLSASGGSYGPDLAPGGDIAQLDSVSHFRLEASDCNALRLSIDDIDQVLELSRIVAVDDCD